MAVDEIKPLHFKKAQHSRSKGHSLLWLLGAILLVCIGYFIWSRPIAPAVFNYWVLGKESPLKVQDGKVNVLLLGEGGGSHEGATLTDTIMVASYDMKTHDVSLISIPRDLWIESYKTKVNALYQIGLDKNQGLSFVESEVGKIYGLTIPYGVRVDFSGFVKAVDLVGGLDVPVERAFEDRLYPAEGKEADMCGLKEEEQDIDQSKADELHIKPGKIKVLVDMDNKIATAAAEPGQGIIYTDENVGVYFPCRYEYLSFKKGVMHMDGETALKFVRSRHGTNGEGSDFARSRRQQLVLKAFKDKVLSVGTLTNPQKVIGLVSTFGSSIETDISEEVYPDFIDMSQKVASVKSYVIDPSGSNPLLMIPTKGNYGGAWVLVPTDDSYNQIHQFVQQVLHPTPEASPAAQSKGT